MHILIKKEFIMNAAKETINYYCDDIIKDGYLGQGITAAVLDTGISLHPDFDSRIVAFRDLEKCLCLP